MSKDALRRWLREYESGRDVHQELIRGLNKDGIGIDEVGHFDVVQMQKDFYGLRPGELSPGFFGPPSSPRKSTFDFWDRPWLKEAYVRKDGSIVYVSGRSGYKSHLIRTLQPPPRVVALMAEIALRGIR